MSSAAPELLVPEAPPEARSAEPGASARMAVIAPSPTPARISVIMPLYNKAPFVEKAIRSALDNGPGVVEVIVVDDGSSDNGADIVESIVDQRIRLIRKENGGVSSARNVGLDLATGDWLAFLDADDYWLPGYIDAIQAMIARFPQCGMVTTRYQFQDDAGHVSSLTGLWHFDEGGKQPAGPLLIDDFYRTMSLGHFCFTCSIVIRRDVIRREALRFPLGEQMGEDLEVIFSAAEATPVALDPRELVIYRDSNLGLRLSRGRLDTLLLPFFQRLVERVESGRMPESMREGAKAYLRNHLKFVVTYAARNKRRREGFRLLRHKLIARHPETLIKTLVTLTLPDAFVTYLRAKLK